MTKLLVDRYENVPDWSLSALINNDFTGLMWHEKAWVEKFSKQFGEFASFSSDTVDAYFCNRPLHGLPCNCVDLDVVWFPPSFLDKVRKWLSKPQIDE